MNKAKKILDTDLYALTGEEFSLGRTNVEVAAAMLAAGIKVIQYREKDKTMLARFKEALHLRDLTAAHGAALIVNDHPDLALAVEADGVHLGQDDLPVEQVRQIVGDRLVIGLSTHSPGQARAAVQAGADYIGVGPIYSTQTKKNVGAPVGLAYLDYVVASIDLPFVAIGGIKEHNIADVRRHGARCIAMVTEIVGAPDIPARIERLRRALATAV